MSKEEKMTAVIFKNTYIHKNGGKDVFWTFQIRCGIKYIITVNLNEDMAEQFINDFIKNWTGEVERHESTKEIDH